MHSVVHHKCVLQWTIKTLTKMVHVKLSLTCHEKNSHNGPQTNKGVNLLLNIEGTVGSVLRAKGEEV